MREGCARGEFQWHSNHAGSLVSPGNICIVLQRIHLALLREDGSLSSLLVSYSLTTHRQGTQVPACEFVSAPLFFSWSNRKQIFWLIRFLYCIVPVIRAQEHRLPCWQHGIASACWMEWIWASSPPTSIVKYIAAERIPFRDFAKCRTDVWGLLIAHYDDLLANTLFLKQWGCGSTLCISAQLHPSPPSSPRN